MVAIFTDYGEVLTAFFMHMLQKQGQEHFLLTYINVGSYTSTLVSSILNFKIIVQVFQNQSFRQLLTLISYQMSWIMQTISSIAGAMIEQLQHRQNSELIQYLCFHYCL